MPYRTDIVYRYDGSYEGLLTCVFESFLHKERPAWIHADGQTQETLFETRRVATDPEKAERVRQGVVRRASGEAEELLYMTFLTCLPNREKILLSFVERALREGRTIMSRLADPTVAAMMQAVRHLTCEAHHLKGFVRFSDIDGVLVGQITPRNSVLPLLSDHFADRYVGERVMLLDKTHGQLLLCAGGVSRVAPAGRLDIPAPGEEELWQRALWRRFYQTIGIKERTNLRLRMSNMPKRFWGDMTELQQEGMQEIARGRG